jgi:hypothetical protein
MQKRGLILIVVYKRRHFVPQHFNVNLLVALLYNRLDGLLK